MFIGNDGVMMSKGEALRLSSKFDPSLQANRMDFLALTMKMYFKWSLKLQLQHWVF